MAVVDFDDAVAMDRHAFLASTYCYAVQCDICLVDVDTFRLCDVGETQFNCKWNGSQFSYKYIILWVCVA